MQRLDLKVRAVNKAHAEILRLWPLLVQALTPFIGQKIELASGDLSAKVKKALPEFPNTTTLRIYRKAQVYSLIFGVYASEWERSNVPHHSDDGGSYERTLYVGHLTSDGTLESFYPFDPEEYRTDWTVEEVKALREDYQTKKRAADTARNKLFCFGEYDT
jgi:hypothetical protein